MRNRFKAKGKRQKAKGREFSVIFGLAGIILAVTFFAVENFAQESSPTPTPEILRDKDIPNKDLPKQTPLSTDAMPIPPKIETSVRPLPSNERIGVDLANQLSLTLDDAIALALQNNNDIDNSRINVKIAEYDLTSTLSVYDPNFTSESYLERRTTPTASTIGGAGATGSITQTDFTGNVGVTGFSPFQGGSYRSVFSSGRITTGNRNATLNPQFPSNFQLAYTQPLFRGRKFDNNRRSIEIAKKNLSLTDAQFRQQAIEVIAQVQQSYWDLVFALRNLQVQIDAVKQAKAQLESNERLVNKGALAPIEIVAATNQVATFEQNVFTAQESVTRAENVLKTLMLKERTNEIWSRPLTPVTPVNLDTPKIGLSEAVGEALKNRPEITQLQTSAEINQIDQRFFKDQTKPQIDLTGTYTSAGLAGSQNSLTNSPPPNLVGNYFNSLGNLIQQDFPTFRAGVTIQIPFKNRAAEADLGRSLVEGNRIVNQRNQAEQIIEADVRNSLQALRSAEARLNSATIARTSAESQYESEQRQFRAGTSTVYLVLQRQTELLTARGRELQAQTDLNKSISNLQRATGITLSANNVSILEGSQPGKFIFRPKTDFTFSATRRYLRTEDEKASEKTETPK